MRDLWVKVIVTLVLLIVVAMLAVWAKREVVKDVRRELQQELADSVQQLREAAAAQRAQMEAEIAATRAKAEADRAKDPVQAANDLLGVLRAERDAAEGVCDR